MMDKRLDPARAMLQWLIDNGKTKEPIPIHPEQYQWLPDSFVNLLHTYAGATSFLEDFSFIRVAGLLGDPPRIYEAKVDEESARLSAVIENRGGLDEGRFTFVRANDPSLQAFWIGHSHIVEGWVTTPSSSPLSSLLPWWWSEGFCRASFDAFGKLLRLPGEPGGQIGSVRQVRCLLGLEEVEPSVTEGLSLYLGPSSALFIFNKPGRSGFSLGFGGTHGSIQRVREQLPHTEVS